MVALDHVLSLSALLFTVGAVGVLWRRNLLVVLLSLQFMLAAGQLAFVAFERVILVEDGGVDRLPPEGQVFSLLAMVVGAVQVVVGLSIILAVSRSRDSVDIEEASSMRW